MKSTFSSFRPWHAAVLGLALLLSACAWHKDFRPSLPVLLEERLNWMDEVAMAKQVAALPITDPVREAELLRTMTQRGVAAGLKEESVRRFFTGQMQAAKVVQEEWLRRHPPGAAAYLTVVPSLTHTIRPALDEIGAQMIARLAQPRSPAQSAALLNESRERLVRAGYSAAVMQPALDGLQAGLVR
jgi:chorismate mutase-like protein